MIVNVSCISSVGDLGSHPMRPTTFIEVSARFYSLSYYCILLKKHEPFAQPDADEVTGVVKGKTNAPEHTRSSLCREEMRLREKSISPFGYFQVPYHRYIRIFPRAKSAMYFNAPCSPLSQYALIVWCLGTGTALP